jgi:tape measure domain-containing protein
VQDDATKNSKKAKILDLNDDQVKLEKLSGSIKDLNSKLQKLPKYKLFDDKSLNTTLSQTEQINKNISNINVSASKLGTTLKSAFAVGAVTLLGNSMLRTAQTFESLRTRLNVATGSLNKAQRAFSDIQTFAAQTKFSVDALTDSYARLANTGSGLLQTNGDILNGLEAIANAVTAVGGGDYEIQRVAEAFARMAAEGRVTYERLEPLTTAGISLQKVAAAAGKSWSQWSDKMAQGNLTFEEVYSAFNKLAMSTQGFGGIARKQTNSLSGAFSNLGDAVKGFQDAVINSTGIKDIIISVTNAITSSINLLTRYVRNDLTVAVTQFKLFILQLQIGFLRAKNVIQDFQKTTTRIDFTGWLPDFSKYRLNLSDYLPELSKVQNTIFDFGRFVKKVFFDVYDAVVGNSYWPDTIKGIADWSNRLYGLAFPGIARFADYIQDVFLDIKDAFFMWKEKIDLEIKVIKDIGALNFIEKFFSDVVGAIKDLAGSGLSKSSSIIDSALAAIGRAIRNFAEFAKRSSGDTFGKVANALSKVFSVLMPGVGELSNLASKLQGAFAKIDLPKFEISFAEFRLDVQKKLSNLSLDSLRENLFDIVDDAINVFKNGISSTAIFSSVFQSLGETFGRIVRRALTDGIKTTFEEDIQDIIIAGLLVAFNKGFRQIAVATLVFKLVFGDDADLIDGLSKLKDKIAEFGQSIAQGLGIEGFLPSQGGFIVGLLFGTAALAIASGKMVGLIAVVAKELLNFFILSKIFSPAANAGAAPAAATSGTFLGKAFSGAFGIAAGLAGIFIGSHIADAINESLNVESTWLKLGTTVGAIFMTGWAISAGTAAFATWVSAIVAPAIIMALKRAAIATVLSAALFPPTAAILAAVGSVVAAIVAALSLPVLLVGLGVAAGSSLIYYALFGDKDAKGIEGRVTRFVHWLGEQFKAFSYGLGDMFGAIFDTIGSGIRSSFDYALARARDIKNFFVDKSFNQPAAPINPQQRRANGGRLSGPGTGRSDSILARVSNGEFVVNAKATAQNLPLLQSINSGLPAFQNGGLIDIDFIRRMENGGDSSPKTKGYVPSGKGGVPIESSGVTIASGLDLGSKDVKYLRNLGLPENLVDKLKPYLGKKRFEAQRALKKKPLNISSSDAELIDSKVIPLFAKQTANEFNSLAEVPGIEFDKLPKEVRTAFTSAKYQYGSLFTKDWLMFAARDASRGHYDKAAERFESSNTRYASRRQAEANLMRSAMAKQISPPVLAVREGNTTWSDILEMFKAPRLNMADGIDEAKEKELETAINNNNSDPAAKKRVARTLIGRLLGLPAYADGTEEPINFIKTPNIETDGLNIGKFDGASFIKNQSFTKQLTTDEKLMLGSREMRRELTRHLTENVKSNIGAYFQNENDTVLTASDAVNKGALSGVDLDLFGGKLKGRIKKDGFKVLFTKQFADGGKISGPGNGRSDSILARLSNGEFVVNAKSTSEHLPLLQSINRGMPGFANGTRSPIGSTLSQINPTQNKQTLTIGGKSINIDLEDFFNTLVKLKSENKDLADNSEELAVSFKKSLDTVDNWAIRLAIGTVSIQELSQKIKPLSSDLGKLATDVKISRTQGTTPQFRTDGAGGVDKQTFDRIKNLIVEGLGVDASKNPLFDQQLTVNILKNLDILSTLNSLQAQITSALVSAQEDPAQKILAEDFVKQVSVLIRERLNQLAPETRDPRAPGQFASPASKQLGGDLSRAFVGDFKSGLSDLLKGKITGKEFGTLVVDSFTGKVVDSFTSRLTDSVFSGDFFANIFGGTGQVGEISGGLLSKLLPSTATPNLDTGKPDGLLSILSGPTKAPIPVTVVPGPGSLFKTDGAGGGLFSGITDKIKGFGSGIGDFFSKGFSGFSSLFSFLPGFAEGGAIPSNGSGVTPVLAHAGEIILNEAQQSRVAAAMNNSSQQVVNLNITGDISRQTKSEIYRMLPSIAEGVNSHNREKGIR